MKPPAGERGRLRIAHVVFSLGVGGLETGLINLLRHLDPDEFEHRILCMKDLGPNTEKARDLGVEVEKIGDLESRNRTIIFKLARCFRRWRPRIVHSRNFGCLDAVIAARLARVPRVVHGEHGWDTFDLEGRSRKRSLIRSCVSPLVHRYVTVSDHLNAWLSGHRGFFAGKVSTIRNGVDAERFQPTPRDHAPESPGLTVGTVGRLVPIKDQANLIDAFMELAPDYPGVRLLIVGDGPLHADLKTQVAASDHSDRVTFAGQSDRVEEHYARMDVFALPSLNEGISNTILEAMASGLPVVATDVGGNPELVQDGVTGSLVPRRDPRALARALRVYLDDPALARAQGGAGRVRAEREFSIPRMAADYRRLYLELAGR